jgi:hypothetical protein
MTETLPSVGTPGIFSLTIWQFEFLSQLSERVNTITHDFESSSQTFDDLPSGDMDVQRVSGEVNTRMCTSAMGNTHLQLASCCPEDGTAILRLEF